MRRNKPQYSNMTFRAQQSTLWPSTSPKRLVLWDNYYLRFDPSLGILGPAAEGIGMGASPSRPPLAPPLGSLSSFPARAGARAPRSRSCHDPMSARVGARPLTTASIG